MQLEELIVEANEDSSWLIDYLKLENTKLNRLKLVNFEVMSRLRKALDKNRHKIKDLEFEKVKFYL